MSSQPNTSAAVTKVDRGTVDQLEDRITAWLNSRIPDLKNAHVVGLRTSDTSGLSGETYIVDIENGDAAAPDKLVVKKDVTENQTNPQSSFANLALIQTVLGGGDGLPIPRVVGVETASDTIGAPFLVMEYVEGDIPSDVPSYATAGFVHDATVDQRSRMWQSGIDFLVRLHRIDWREYKLGQLRFDFPGDTELDRCVSHAISMFRAEAQGRTAPICEHAIEWLLTDRPPNQPESICWGDARIGNMIWRDFDCVAVIDWEMCSLGCPAVDLGWWSFFHRWSTFGQGNPDLDGMCVGQPLADLYEARGGVHIDNFRYFEVLAAVRGLSIWLRTYQAMCAAGALPADMDPLGESIHMIRVLQALMPEFATSSG
jgi:aminoglycoside phosphotransferase (APT) family kinase protein